MIGNKVSQKPIIEGNFDNNNYSIQDISNDDNQIEQLNLDPIDSSIPPNFIGKIKQNKKIFIIAIFGFITILIISIILILKQKKKFY